MAKKDNADKQAAPWAPSTTDASEVVDSENENSSENSDTILESEIGVEEEFAPSTELVTKPESVAGEVVDMVTVTVPKAFKLRIDHFREFDFKAGVQEMERSVAEHWYSKANGITIYEPVQGK